MAFRFETANERWSWCKISEKIRISELARANGIDLDLLSQILFDAGVRFQRDMVDRTEAMRALMAAENGNPIKKPRPIEPEDEELERRLRWYEENENDGI